MKKQNRLLSLILSLFLLLFTLVPQSALTVKAEGNSEMAVHFIDVGQGNAILVQSGGQNLLYDGGDQSHADLIISYLQEQNVENIDYMIASHYDEDHIGGLVPCIDNFSVSNIFGPDYVHTSNLFNNFMNTATANAIIVQYPSVGETFDFGTGSFTVLAPNGISQNSNDNSLVIKLENGSNSFIFTGDAEETSEAEMLTNGIDISADVYKVAHHGSRSASTQEFLNAVHPKYAVISCGEGNSYGHPHAEVLNRLRSMGVEVFRTDEQGSIIASSDGENINWNCSATDSWQSGEQTESDRENSEDENPGDENSGNAISDAVTSEQTTYVLNTNTKKFHRETCGSVSQIKEENFQKVQMSREELEQSGYSPCKNCNP